MKGCYCSNIVSGLFNPSSLLDIFQGVYICAHPVIWTAIMTQMQFSRRTRKSQEELETNF